MLHRQRRALRMTLAAVTMATSALVVGAVGAPPASAAGVPTCVVSSVYNSGHTVRVTNWCSSAYRVKVVWAYATDSSCVYLRPGYYFTDTRSWPARFDGLSTC